MIIIDPPSPFDPPARWRAHLRRMMRLQRRKPNEAAIAEAIRTAEAQLAASQ